MQCIGQGQRVACGARLLGTHRCNRGPAQTLSMRHHPKHRHSHGGGGHHHYHHPTAAAPREDAATTARGTLDDTRITLSHISEAADVLTEELRHGPLGERALEDRKKLCDSGLPDMEMCELAEPNPVMPAVEEAIGRGKWLLGLLIVQSTSSFVLDAYQELLKDHLVVTLFLTMLVGAGGNSGNQSSIQVIRGLATGRIKPSWQSARNTVAQQATVGLMLGAGLSAGGFLRVWLWNGNLLNAFAISLSLFAIVMTSVILGTTLPFAMAQVGIDPANSGTSIQVVMDIIGVAITCSTCHLVLVQLAAHAPGLAS